MITLLYSPKNNNPSLKIATFIHNTIVIKYVKYFFQLLKSVKKKNFTNLSLQTIIIVFFYYYYLKGSRLPVKAESMRLSSSVCIYTGLGREERSELSNDIEVSEDIGDLDHPSVFTG